jgi:hypothetical protein
VTFEAIQTVKGLPIFLFELADSSFFFTKVHWSTIHVRRTWYWALKDIYPVPKAEYSVYELFVFYLSGTPIYAKQMMKVTFQLT